MKRHYVKGELIRFSEGEYSDYCTGNTYEVLAPIDLKEFSDGFISEHGPHKSTNRFVEFLEENLPLKAITVTECWVGAYDYDASALEKD